MPHIRILVTDSDRLSPSALRLLRSAGEVVERPSADLTSADFADFDVAWTRLGHRVGASTIGERPRVRIIAVPATGLDLIDTDICAALGIEVISLKGEVDFLRQVRATAEHTIGLMLAALRRTVPAHLSVLEGRWQREEFRGDEIYEQQVAVIGHGRLGGIVCEYLYALGASVVSFDPRTNACGRCTPAATLADAVADASIVTLHVDLTEATTKLIDGQIVAGMNRRPILVNTSRGELLDESAVADGVSRGHLGGLAVDVLSGEPNPLDDHPFRRLARSGYNVIVTPHIGGNTRQSGAKTDDFIAQRIVDRLQGPSR